LVPVTTQHALSTTLINVPTGKDQVATSTSYFRAIHFGMGQFEGQSLLAYGRYEDELVLTNAGWRIDKRNLIYMGPFVGNISIFGN